jgi:hypothetical protein
MKHKHADLWKLLLQTQPSIAMVVYSPRLIIVDGQRYMGTFVSAIPPCEPTSLVLGSDVCHNCHTKTAKLDAALKRLDGSKIPGRLCDPTMLKTEIAALERLVRSKTTSNTALTLKATELASLFHRKPSAFYKRMKTLFESTHEIQRDLVLNMVDRIDTKSKAKFSQTVLDAALVASVTMGKKNYNIMRVILKFPTIQCIKSHSPTADVEKEGISRRAYQTAKENYGDLPCFSVFDGTRVLRVLEIVVLPGFAEASPETQRNFLSIVGLGWWGNARYWPFHLTVQGVLERYHEPGDTCELDALRRFTIEVRKSPTLLAREVRIHMVGCMNAELDHIPTGVHPRMPLPGGLRSEAIMSTIILERRLAFLDDANVLKSKSEWVMLIGSAFDPEASHMKAAKLLATIRPDFTKYIALGCTWEMYAMPVLGPLPCIFLMDWEHILRLFYKRVVKHNYATHGDKEAFATKYVYKCGEGDLERTVTISTGCLRALYDKARDSCEFLLTDLDIALYFDSKTDAALKVFSRQNIALLREHDIGESEGFILYTEAVLDIMDAITCTTNMNPYDRLKQMARGVSFFRHLFVYSKKNHGLNDNNCIHAELMSCIEMLFASRIALTLTLFHWFYDIKFLENQANTGSGKQESYMGYIQNKTCQTARPTTVPPSMADVLHETHTSQHTSQAIGRLNKKDKNVSTTANIKRQKVAALLAKVGEQYSQEIAGHHVPKGNYKEFVRFLTGACEDGFKQDEVVWAQVAGGEAKAHMEELGVFGMKALVPHLRCIDPAHFNTKAGLIFDGSADHEATIFDNAEKTLAWIELDTKANTMKNASVFAGFKAEYSRLHDWQAVEAHTWMVPARLIPVDKDEVDPVDENDNYDSDGEPLVVEDDDDAEGVPLTDDLMTPEDWAVWAAGATEKVDDLQMDDSPEPTRMDTIPTDTPESTNIPPTDTIEPKHTTLRVNMVLSDILKSNKLHKLDATDPTSVVAMEKTMTSHPRHVHEITVTTSTNSAKPLVRVREITKTGIKRNPMWISNNYLNKHEMLVTYDIHIQSALRVLQLGPREWVSRERFNKFFHRLDLRGYQRKQDGIDLWAGSVIIYATQPGVPVVGRVVELTGDRGTTSSSRPLTEMDVQDTEEVENEYRPDTFEKPSNNGKRKRAGAQISSTKRLEECRSTHPGLTIMCRLYVRQAGKEHDYEIDQLACQKGISPRSVWAFSDHEMLSSIPSHTNSLHLETAAWTKLIEQNTPPCNKAVPPPPSPNDHCLPSIATALTTMLATP